MKNRTPAPPNGGQPIDFVPATRRSARHDGWTPERQRSFIEALADTGNVRRAAAMVNMSPEGAYYLRRQPEAASFAAAWSAALDHGVQRMKDIAFERAVEGELVPILAGGKLLGYRRRYNDRLLMFCLRHYGEDANGKRTTVNYFSTRASAGADASAAPPPSPDSTAAASAETTTIRTTVSGRGEPHDLADSAAILANFAVAELDAPARAAILAALTDCAARRRAIAGTPDDPERLFVAAEQPFKEMLVRDGDYSEPRRVRRQPPPADDNPVVPETMLDPEPMLFIQPGDQFRSGPQEMSWAMLDDDAGMAEIDQAVASLMAEPSTAAKPVPSGAEGSKGARRADHAPVWTSRRGASGGRGRGA